MRKERVLSADLARRIGAFRGAPERVQLTFEQEVDRLHELDAELLGKLLDGGTVLATVNWIDTSHPRKVGVMLTPTWHATIPQSRLSLRGYRGRNERLGELRLGEQVLVYLVSIDGALEQVVLGEA